jgi:hypothetical protein
MKTILTTINNSRLNKCMAITDQKDELLSEVSIKSKLITLNIRTLNIQLLVQDAIYDFRISQPWL